MTPEQFLEWRKKIGSQAKAQEAIGIGRRLAQQCEIGRREDGRPVEVPRSVALAIAAFEKGLPPYEHDLRRWRESINLSPGRRRTTQKDAAEAIGLSRRIYQYYEKGAREDGSIIQVPKVVRLACGALLYGLAPYGDTED